MSKISYVCRMIFEDNTYHYRYELYDIDNDIKLGVSEKYSSFQECFDAADNYVTEYGNDKSVSL